jgi:hypothetical protein
MCIGDKIALAYDEAHSIMLCEFLVDIQAQNIIPQPPITLMNPVQYDDWRTLHSLTRLSTHPTPTTTSVMDDKINNNENKNNTINYCDNNNSSTQAVSDNNTGGNNTSSMITTATVSTTPRTASSAVLFLSGAFGLSDARINKYQGFVASAPRVLHESTSAISAKRTLSGGMYV